MPRNPSLEAYRGKRQAGQTPEPFGRGTPHTRRFVVQKHAARREHYDFRLEWRGVLLSWAVPRVPSLDPAVKRLAVHVEDHPSDYALFEGTIPEGNYGAGAVIVWDTGAWVPLDDPDEGVARGKLLFELYGYKLRGLWTLVRGNAKGSHGRDWLLIKKPDSFSRPDGGLSEASVLSGLDITAVGDVAARAEAMRGELVTRSVPTATSKTRLGLMLAQTAQDPFTDPAWIFELKYDGFRLLARRDGNTVALTYRHGMDASALYPEVARAVLALPAPRFVLDGELVVHDAAGLPSFQNLQQRAQLNRAGDIAKASVDNPATLYAFDLLTFADLDLRALPLLERKAFLARLVPTLGPLRYADHVVGAGEALFAEVQKRGLEGLIAKQANAPYRAGRTAAWLKIPVHREGDFVIVGFTAPRGSRAGLGALQLARWHAGGWQYAGGVGTGLDDATLQHLRDVLEPLIDPTLQTDPPCLGVPSTLRGASWVVPHHVCVVRYKEVTREGGLRHPVFLRLRDDKIAADCQDDLPPEPAPESQPPAPQPVAQTREVPFTHLEKIFWPEEGYTKGDLIGYYREIAPYLLPYLKDRPLVLTRFPDGIHGKSFFQKDAPTWSPAWLRTERMWSENAERDIDYFVCEDVESLLYVINMGTIPLHIWSSRIQTLGQPDWCILDLDPKGAPFAHVVQVARAIYRLCQKSGLTSFVKTSGSTGLHVLIPLGGALTYEQSRSLAHVLARLIVDALPALATLERAIGARGGRVYIDYLQNGHGRLLVAPWSARPVPGALVSTPLTWREVGPKLDFHRFDIRTVLPRIAKQKRDPMVALLTATADVPAALARLAADLS